MNLPAYEKAADARDHAAYEAFGTLRGLHLGGHVPEYSRAGVAEIIARYEAASVAMKAAEAEPDAEAA